MKTEHWALVVSVLALLVSVGAPVYQAKTAAAHVLAARRSLLLQTYLSAKSTTFIALHELIYLLGKHGDKMDADQRVTLEATVPQMQTQYAELGQLHHAWSNFDDGTSLKRIEVVLAEANVMASDAADSAKLVENGRKSYEEPA